MKAPAPHFDREVALGELLRSVPGEKLGAALTKVLGGCWHMVEGDGTPVLGPGAGLAPRTAADPVAVPLHVDMEIVGTLVASGAPRELVEGTAAWLELMLASVRRYRMAADLHLEVVNMDYEILQREHAALQKSEERYRELAAQLERRVATQVEAIELAQRQLYQAEKMASVGSLAAGMAHEINNPIGFIGSNLTTAIDYVDSMRLALLAFHGGDRDGAQALWRKVKLDLVLEDFPVLLSESAAGAQRIARIVAKLKDYASIDSGAMAEVDLSDAVRTVASILGDQIPQGVELAMDLQSLPKILCDRGRLNQVITSLLQNSLHAVIKGGVIRLTTRVTGGEIRIAVSDNGCGIAPEVLSRIFDPFFTTRDVGKGTGLGLTVSRDIVAAHGGRIEVESAVGNGSTFTVCLPLADGVRLGTTA
jgi:two-component system, NtrC family, sensor kinase